MNVFYGVNVMRNIAKFKAYRQHFTMRKSLSFIVLFLFSFESFAVSFELKLVEAAEERTKRAVKYDGKYLPIPYPNGDVPDNIGVCTDLIIRSYRRLGFDLQRLVHEDIKAHFELYPSKRIWGLLKPDTNIDHRRVPNLQAFFKRHGEVLPISDDPSQYQPGDIVTWMLPGNLPHIGLLSAELASGTNIPLVIHNIGRGPVAENMLFSFKITGHYKYNPSEN